MTRRSAIRAVLNRRAAIAAAVVLFCSGLHADPAARVTTEAELKAVLLFHLTQYVSWSHESTNAPEAFILGICGPDPFGNALDDVVRNEKVGGKPIHVVRRQNFRDLTNCALVYVSPDYRQPLSRTLSALHRRPSLTVGEDPDFIDQGGMVRFKRAPGQKIRLEIELERMRRHGFNVSAQLLRVCEVIGGEAVR